MSEHIKQFLSPFLAQHSHSWKLDLLKQWPTIMGSLAEYVSIEKIESSSITLGVTDSSWLQELYLMGNTILTTINQSLDEPRFKTIRFKQKGIAQKSNAPKTIESTSHSICITFSEQEQKALDAIQDSTLREVLRSFLVRCHRERSR